MRKLLLASAAAFGASAGMLGVASAQTTAAPTLAPAQGMILQAPNGGSGANNNNNYQTGMLPGPFANPTPGSFVVRFNGAEWFYISMGGGNGFVTPATASNPGGEKLAPYNMFEYFRLYPGFDAMASNGLRYGGQTEIRENWSSNSNNGFQTAAPGATTKASTAGGTVTVPAAGATAGSATNSTSSNSASSFTCTQTLYVRRAFIYLAGDQWGMVRMGQTDGVNGIFDNGVTTFQNFDTGGWNGDTPNAVPGNLQPAFPFFSQQGAEYGNEKIVYLTPQFFGFDFGVQWAPNNNNGWAPCAVAGTGCSNLSSSSQQASAGNADGGRFMNQYVVGGRYQGSFGPVALYGYASYTGSGAVDYTGATPIGNAPGSTYNGKFNGMSVGQGGIAVTVAGLTVGGNVTAGNYNGLMALQPQGGAHAIAWLGGVQYAYGPVVVGASYYNFQSQGAVNLTNVSQRYTDGLDIGGTYNLAPGLWFYGQYLYGQQHQGGFDFITGAAGVSTNNTVHAQAFEIGTKVRW
jgi:Gram-negative porin